MENTSSKSSRMRGLAYLGAFMMAVLITAGAAVQQVNAEESGCFGIPCYSDEDCTEEGCDFCHVVDSRCAETEEA